MLLASSMRRLSRPWADPKVRKRFIDLGQDVFPQEQQTPEALGNLQKAEIEKWWPIIKAAGVKSGMICRARLIDENG